MARKQTPAQPGAGIPTPALLRASRGAYGIGIRRELRDAGIADLPPGGTFILGGIANHGVALADLTHQLGPPERGERLLAALVGNGFLAHDGSEVTLTDKGRRAAAAVADGVAAVEDRLRAQLTPVEYEGFRHGLVALCDLRDGWEDDASPAG